MKTGDVLKFGLLYVIVKEICIDENKINETKETNGLILKRLSRKKCSECHISENYFMPTDPILKICKCKKGVHLSCLRNKVNAGMSETTNSIFHTHYEF